MSHVRQRIREAFTTTITGLTTTGTNVFASRVWAVSDTNLPALLIHTDEETIEVLTVHGPAALQRTLTVRIEGIARATADLDDTLDTICSEVETAINATESASTAGDLLDSPIRLVSITVEYERAERPVGRITMSWSGTYTTAANAPDTAL